MSNENETRAAIIREMRDKAAEADGKLVAGAAAWFRAFADRIEAASAREHSKWERERREYEKLHDCFWAEDAIQNIVRQMLGARDDLRRVDPKEADDLDYYAHELMKAAKKREQAPAEGPSSGAKPDAETIADIVREMRNSPFSWSIPSEIPGVEKCNCEAEKLADRIEAAAKREMDAIIYSFDPTKADRSRAPDPCAYALEAMEPPCVATPGNADALREALSDACYAMFNFLKAQNGGYEEMANALDKAKAALAAPPRNCDVYRTVEEAFSACHADRGYISDPVAERRSTISFMLSNAQETDKNEQCAPPIAKETAKIEQCTPPIAKIPPNFYQPCNAAAIREALEDVVADCLGCTCTADCCDTVCKPSLRGRSIVKALAALAAPARNCDILSEEAANEAWDEYRHSHVLPHGGWDFRHVIALLYAPAEGGDHA